MRLSEKKNIKDKKQADNTKYLLTAIYTLKADTVLYLSKQNWCSFIKTILQGLTFSRY